MDINALRELYDRDQRREVQFPGATVDRLPHLTRLREHTGAFNQIIYADLTATTANATIREQVAYFQGLNQRFEWKHFTHDQPTDMLDRLRAHGFEIGEAEAALVLDLTAASDGLFNTRGLDVRKITDSGQVHHVLSVQSRVFGGVDEMDEADNPIADQLAGEMQAHSDSVSLYAVYMDGDVISAAWVRYTAGDSQFASLWGGATLTAYRGRGAYSALLAARAAEARERERRFLTVDASPMSQPILEKHGFQLIGHSHPCEWSPREDNA